MAVVDRGRQDRQPDARGQLISVLLLKCGRAAPPGHTQLHRSNDYSAPCRRACCSSGCRACSWCGRGSCKPTARPALPPLCGIPSCTSPGCHDGRPCPRTDRLRSATSRRRFRFRWQPSPASRASPGRVYAGAAAETRLLIARVQTATALAIANIRIVKSPCVQQVRLERPAL